MKNKEIDVEIGDWIIFWYGGKRVIGQVNHKEEMQFPFVQLYTDVGVVKLSEVLEVWRVN